MSRLEVAVNNENHPIWKLAPHLIRLATFVLIGCFNYNNGFDIFLDGRAIAIFAMVEGGYAAFRTSMVKEVK